MMLVTARDLVKSPGAPMVNADDSTALQHPRNTEAAMSKRAVRVACLPPTCSAL
jgi:hypothetical protein